LPLQDALVSTLEAAGYSVLAASDGSSALDAVASARVDLVVTDVQMQPMDGRELLRRLHRQRPDLPVLVMTAYGTIEQAVAAMRDGAADYIVKPFEAEVIEQRVARFLRRPDTCDRLLPVAQDPKTHELLGLAARVAASEVTVLLTGESGTGKEVLARFIHANSKRSAGPFVGVNCAAIPEQMLEALLFGYEKGAFTGAHVKSTGKFVQANGGTLLLDEITEMDLSLQAKLLRVLQEREVEPLGATKAIPLDLRVIATSNRDLEQTVRQGQFREDLYYRLSVFPLALAPLRERPGDIVALARRFIDERAGAKHPRRLSAAAESSLRSYPWPGNVRELENVVQRALVLSEGEAAIEPRHLALSGGAERSASSTIAAAVPLGLVGELFEEEARRIVTALEASCGGRKRAAQQLGISDRTLRYKLSKIRAAGIAVPGDRGAQW
jgi:two-component system response regulator FlrC